MRVNTTIRLRILDLKQNSSLINIKTLKIQDSLQEVLSIERSADIKPF
jgi:hypothetical protein